MNVRFIYKKIEHHASHSGYDLFADHAPGEDYRPGLIYWLASKLPARWRRKVKAWNSEWYRPEGLFTELELYLRLRVPGKRLYHFLYGEDAVRHSPKYRLRLNNKLVASFHQPPAVFDELPFYEDKSLFALLDGVVTLCRDQAAYFERLMPAERVFIVPHGVDTEFWRPDEAVPRKTVPTFLTVGWWQRDIDVLKAAIPRIVERDPAVQFRIVTFEHLWEHFDGLPNTTMLAGISDQELMDEYRSNTALFIPLKEVTANNAVLESMSCGTPVIATDKGGMSEYVDDRCAVLIPPTDVDAAVEAVLSLAGDPDRVGRMAVAARSQAEAFSWPRVGQQMGRVYRRVLGLPDAD